MDKLFVHLLAPLGVKRRPTTIAEAVATYRKARDRAEGRFGRIVSRELDVAVASALGE